MNLCGGDTIVDSDLVDLVSDPVSFRFVLIFWWFIVYKQLYHFKIPVEELFGAVCEVT